MRKVLSSIIIILTAALCITGCSKPSISISADQEKVEINPVDYTTQFLTGEVTSKNDDISKLTVKFDLQGADLSSFSLMTSFTNASISSYFYGYSINSLKSTSFDYTSYVPYIKRITLTAESASGATDEKTFDVTILR